MFDLKKKKQTKNCQFIVLMHHGLVFTIKIDTDTKQTDKQTKTSSPKFYHLMDDNNNNK